MKYLFVTCLLAALSMYSHSDSMQDVIYKKDGSIIRGTLIEQDFQNGRYKIELQGGSIFSVQQDDIEKITKESPAEASVSNQGQVNVNVTNNPNFQNSPVQSNTMASTSLNAQAKDYAFANSLRIGSVSKTFTDSQDDGIEYSGFNLAYQRNLNEHAAVYFEYNNADFDSYVIDGENYEIIGFADPDTSFTSIEASFMLSTNNYIGWQFYAGLGAFSEDYNFNNTTDSASGVVFTLGLGYSWKPVQIQLRVSGHGSSDYGVDEYGEDYSTSNVVLQVGANF